MLKIFTVILVGLIGLSVCEDDLISSTDDVQDYIRIKNGLSANYTAKIGERLRLECEFDSNEPIEKIYWLRNLEEVLTPTTKRGRISVMQRGNSTSTLVFRKLELLDKGSYSCYAENKIGNVSQEANLNVIDTTLKNSNKNKKQPSYAKDVDYLSQLADSDSGESEDFPQLDPQILESNEEKGFCEPYRGSICTNLLNGNYSIYSMNAQQQEQIEERIKSLLPLLTNKNSISKQCAQFALPSLCLFAFPLCDSERQQPKQICRTDCKQLQFDICKDEYNNIKSLFANKFSNNIQQASNFLIDCNQLPPSSDIQTECLPIVQMQMDKFETSIFTPSVVGSGEKCIVNNGYTYRGSQSYTRSGAKCLKWDDQLTYMTKALNFKYNPELNGHNFCRNIDNDNEPWCFTSERKKEYCGIQRCSIDDTDKKLTNLLYILIPAICVPLVVICLFLTFCYCRRTNKDTISNGSSTNHINSNTKLRMSNGGSSIGSGGLKHTTLKQQQQHQPQHLQNGKATAYGASSKSSITSSSHNVELYPFLQQQQKLQQVNDAYGYVPQQQHQVIPIQHQQQQVPQQVPTMMQQYLQQMNIGATATLQSQSNGDYCVKQYQANNIRLLQEIGKGTFGNIYIGELVGSNNTPTSVIKVIIKTLDETVHLNAEDDFYQELNAYTTIKHRNLSNLIGLHSTNMDFLFDDTASTLQQQQDQFPRCMIMEYLCNGNLHDYLLQRACANTNLSLSSGCSGAISRNVNDFLYISQQVAAALEYLTSKSYVHKDIAARNILIGENLVVKLTDIAQYTDKYSKDYYKFQNKQLPVRWMSPESLLFGRYAADTDVWMYGVLLWEIFNYGTTPYSGCTNPEAVQMIRDRQLLLIPDECPQRVYQLMLECWHENSVQRPTFNDILNRLKNWENYYTINPASQNTVAVTNGPFMTNSYSSNSQNSCTNNHTGSTGLSTSSPTQPQIPNGCYSPPAPPLPPPTASLFNNMKFKRPHSPPSSTITSCSSTRIYREIETNSLAGGARGSQRQLVANFAPQNGTTNSNLISNKNLIPSI